MFLLGLFPRQTKTLFSLCAGMSPRPEPGAVCAFSLRFSSLPSPLSPGKLSFLGKALPFPAASLSASPFSAEELSVLKSKLLLKAGLRETHKTPQWPPKMLPNAASSRAGEWNVVFRIENSNFPKLGINRVVHGIVVCATRMCAGYSLSLCHHTVLISRVWCLSFPISFKIFGTILLFHFPKLKLKKKIK